MILRSLLERLRGWFEDYPAKKSLNKPRHIHYANMVETIVQRIRTIETISEDAPIDKDAVMRKVFESYAENKIVRAVMDGRTTFSQAYQNALGNYDSWRPLLPQFPPEGFEQNIADLEASIGESPLDSRWQSKLENPLGMAAMFGLGGVVAGAIIPTTEKPKLSARREFLGYLLETGVAFSTLGAIGGGAISYQKKKGLDRLNENAMYLDNIHARLYSR